ncbi:hypothetical protein SLA2020_032890 [Shorea laevis]
MSTLKIDDVWVRKPSVLKQHINSFFVGLFTRKETHPASSNYTDYQLRMTEEDGDSLLRPVELEEIRCALFSMKGLKSPGPDGIQPIFYQKHWEEVSGTLLTLITNALRDGHFDPSLLKAHIALIPKGDSPDVIQKFRPICLLNVAYKVLSKVLVNWLRPFLQQLIGPFQNSFLKGRCTTDNIILTQEAIHSMRKMRGRRGAMVWKIDLHKAFDSIDWSFLRQVLQDFNISAPLIQLIMFSITYLQLSVLWNGEELPSFNPQRGLRQGDPLSPYLFIMAMEKLSHKIQSRVQSKLWKPFKISRGALALSHLFFADDLMLFCEASQEQVEVVMDCLTKFSKESGLEINSTKSKLYVSPNIQSHVAGVLSDASGIPLTSDLGTYLGVPILHGRPSVSTYKHILEKIQVKLAGWKRSLLSMAGRRILVQYVTSAIPTYTMQSILLPNSVCSAIDSLNRRFLWGSGAANKPHLVNWDTICTPRDLGGLGLRSARENNQAMITKLGWQLISTLSKPWCKALLAKYLKNGSLMHCSITQTASATWKSILKCRSILQLGLRWRVGDGQQIKFWQDIWVGDKPLHEEALSPVLSASMDILVSHAITSAGEAGEWNEVLLGHLLPRNVMERILAIPIPMFAQQPNSAYWTSSQAGLFSVKSAFYLLQKQHVNLTQQEERWKWVWKLQCLEKIKLFVWLLQRNRVLTNSVRFERHFATTPVCPRCEQEPETPLHLLRDCFHSRLIWESSTVLSNTFFNLSFEEWLRRNAQDTSSNGALFHN